jgi:hypothetical protein
MPCRAGMPLRQQQQHARGTLPSLASLDPSASSMSDSTSTLPRPRRQRQSSGARPPCPTPHPDPTFRHTSTLPHPPPGPYLQAHLHPAPPPTAMAAITQQSWLFCAASNPILVHQGTSIGYRRPRPTRITARVSGQEPRRPVRPAARGDGTRDLTPPRPAPADTARAVATQGPGPVCTRAHVLRRVLGGSCTCTQHVHTARAWPLVSLLYDTSSRSLCGQ